MKKILITGSNSYIGINLEKWLNRHPEQYSVDTISVRDNKWKKLDFSRYNIVVHVAGIVHLKEKPEMEDVYFKVNRDLSIDIAKKSKASGVSQFIFLSTMAVYGEEGKIGEDTVITPQTRLNPKTYYAKSKIEAENGLNILNDKKFKIVVLRPPMVYGPNCRGNYAKLEKMAIKSPVFPFVENKRSMLSIDNLCQFVIGYIDNDAQGLFFPQNSQYVNTSYLVKQIAEKNGRNIYLSKSMGWLVTHFGKRSKVIGKIFGNLVYEKW